MEKNTAINELNAFLKGEYMAIDSYEKYIRHCSSKNNQDLLQNIQNDHKQHAKDISARIKDLGGKPTTGVGFSGKIAETMTSIKNFGDSDDATILKSAYSGERKGIQMAEEIVKGDLDKKSADLINSILTIDKSHLDTIKSYVTM